MTGKAGQRDREGGQCLLRIAIRKKMHGVERFCPKRVSVLKRMSTFALSIRP